MGEDSVNWEVANKNFRRKGENLFGRVGGSDEFKTVLTKPVKGEGPFKNQGLREEGEWGRRCPSVTVGELYENPPDIR
jgi:hypothetical protein